MSADSTAAAADSTHASASDAAAAAPVPSLCVPPVAPLSHVQWRRKLVVALVGLPARGKSYVATKIVNWMRWRGNSAELFNVGKARRALVGGIQDASFFAPDNVAAKAARDALAFEVIDRMLGWMKAGGEFAVLDATNSTRARRAAILRRIAEVSPVLPVCFVESLCTDPVILSQNYRAKIRHSPDYAGMDPDQAMRDLLERVANYERVYETLDEGPEGSPREDVSYIKVVNLASKCICNRIHGQPMHALASFLMSIHIQPRPIFLTRAGHSVGAVDERGMEASAFGLLSPCAPSVPSTEAAYPSSSPAPGPSPDAASYASQAGGWREPLLTTYSQDDTAELTESGRRYSRALSAFVAQRVLAYWDESLVSKRDSNSAAVEAERKQSMERERAQAAAAEALGRQSRFNSEASAASPGRQSRYGSEATDASAAAVAAAHAAGVRELSPNDVAAASVFSPPTSLPSSPLDSRLWPGASAAGESAPEPPPAPLPASATYDENESRSVGGALSERSTAVIGSGSMLLTLSRAHADDTLPLVVVTSTLPRALQTVAPIASRALYVQQQAALNAIDRGVLSSLTLQQIREEHPEQYDAWLHRPFWWRPPGGESQADKCRQLEAFMYELERQRLAVLVVSHASTLQLICGYFSNLPCQEFAAIPFRQHQLLELRPTATGWQLRLWEFCDGHGGVLEQPRLIVQKEDEQTNIYSHAENFYA